MKAKSILYEIRNTTTPQPEHLMLEDEVIEILINWLKADRWSIVEYCKGSKHGIDLFAQRNNEKMIIEAKGAKGNPSHGATKKKKFSSGQILTHLGVAIIKVLKERNNYPEAEIAIAHPDDPIIRNLINPIIPSLKIMGIRFLWANKNGSVYED